MSSSLGIVFSGSCMALPTQRYSGLSEEKGIVWHLLANKLPFQKLNACFY
jgi:hypothetical protein